jgi:hypothetical protein
MVTHVALTDQSIATGAVDDTLEEIQAQTNALLALSSTGGSLTADGTEQTLIIVNEPLGCWWPNVLFIDLDNMILGDTIIIRIYYRLSDAGTLKLWDSQTFTGADGSLVNLAKILDITFMPNRHGFQVSLQQTAGTNRVYPWEFIAEV